MGLSVVESLLHLSMKKKKAENEVKPDPDADYEDESMQEYFEEELHNFLA